MPNDYEQLKMRVEELERILADMQRVNSITPEFKQVLQRYNSLSVSSKGVDSEDIAINEAGASTHTVLADPSGFLQIDIGGTVYYIPYYPA